MRKYSGLRRTWVGQIMSEDCGQERFTEMHNWGLCEVRATNSVQRAQGISGWRCASARAARRDLRDGLQNAAGDRASVEHVAAHSTLSVSLSVLAAGRRRNRMYAAFVLGGLETSLQACRDDVVACVHVRLESGGRFTRRRVTGATDSPVGLGGHAGGAVQASRFRTVAFKFSVVCDRWQWSVGRTTLGSLRNGGRRSGPSAAASPCQQLVG